MQPAVPQTQLRLPFTNLTTREPAASGKSWDLLIFPPSYHYVSLRASPLPSGHPRRSFPVVLSVVRSSTPPSHDAPPADPLSEKELRLAELRTAIEDLLLLHKLPYPVEDLLVLPLKDFETFVRDHHFPALCVPLLREARGLGPPFLIIPDEYESRGKKTKGELESYLKFFGLCRQTISFLVKQRTRRHDRHRKAADRRRYEEEAEKFRQRLQYAKETENFLKLDATVKQCLGLPVAVRSHLKSDLQAAELILTTWYSSF